MKSRTQKTRPISRISFQQWRDKLPADWEQRILEDSPDAQTVRTRQAFAIVMLRAANRPVPHSMLGVKGSSICRARRVLRNAPGWAVRSLFETGKAKRSNGLMRGLDTIDHDYSAKPVSAPLILPQNAALRNEFFNLLSPGAIHQAWRKQAALFLHDDPDGTKESTVRLNELYQELFKSN